MIDSEPVLYIIIPTYLNSMNTGKAIAQACHAANAFVAEIEYTFDEDASTRTRYGHWKNQTKQGFGTTLVLQAETKQRFDVLMDIACKYSECGHDTTFANTVVDPTYPIRDGEVTHLIELTTCGYIFIDKNTDSQLLEILKDYDLHV